jgi:hypothetical protein
MYSIPRRRVEIAKAAKNRTTEGRPMTTGDECAGDWIDRLDALYTPVIADVLDRLGYRDQTFRAEVRPLFPGARAAGGARTVRTIPAPVLAPAEP